VLLVLGNVVATIVTGLGLFLYPEAYLAIIRISSEHSYAELNEQKIQRELLEAVQGIPLSTMAEAATYAKLGEVMIGAVAIGWTAATWGGFRHLAKVPLWRAVLAFGIYLAMGIVIVAIFTVIVMNVRKI
jgi:hypothetical protein